MNLNRQQAEAALRESEERYRALFNAIDEGFCIIEVIFDASNHPVDYRFLETNPAFEKQTGLVEAEGRTARELVPDLEAHWSELYGKVVLTGEPARFVSGSDAMGRWFDVYAFRLGGADSRKAALIFNDISDRKQAEEALRESEEQSRGVLESITDAFYALSTDWRFTYINKQAEPLMGTRREQMIGLVVWEVYPGLAESAFGPLYRRAAEEKVASSLTAFYPDHNRWYEVHVYPAPRGITVYFRDVTERNRADEELHASEERFRTLFESLGQGVIFHDAATGTVIGANPAAELILGVSLEELQGRPTQDRLWQAVRDDGSPLPPSEFATARALATGQAVHGHVLGVFNPRLGQYRFLEASAVPQFRAGEDRPFLAYTLINDITERREMERERTRLLEESRAQATRERIINQIGQAVRDETLTPDEVQVKASHLLGQALGLDRCYFSIYDPARNILQIGGDWRRPDLPPIAGKRPGTDYAHMSAQFYSPGSTSAAYRDIREAPLSPDNLKRFEDLGFRAVVGVAYREGAGSPITAAMGAVMVDGPRDWTQSEVEVMEAAATLVWTTLQSIRRQQRERHIASQLQDALIPPAPPALPGLDLAAYYQPALEEASVGGDFYDVFPVEKGCTALVVADLSGKGLAAARQVATVRDMLRFALYEAPSVTDAVSRLNAVLVEHNLLAGFATLFVGMYDHGARTLTYVNCGQEPGLVCRSTTGKIEPMPPTGAILGSFTATPYEQCSVTLMPGDVLALFTDGLTEVGPTRREQLEVAGVATLLQRCVGGQKRPAQEIADRLIEGVNAFAHGGSRDDVALLVGVVS